MCVCRYCRVVLWTAAEPFVCIHINNSSPWEQLLVRADAQFSAPCVHPSPRCNHSHDAQYCLILSSLLLAAASIPPYRTLLHTGTGTLLLHASIATIYLSAPFSFPHPQPQYCLTNDFQLPAPCPFLQMASYPADYCRALWWSVHWARQYTGNREQKRDGEKEGAVE